MNVLFETESGCHVFQLPPSNPMLAASWEGHHIWSGGVRVVQEQSPSSSLLLSVQLFESDTRELFGQCPMDHPDALRRATDSSRCFVVKVVQGSQFAFVGLMFDKSNDGSQFGAVVADTQRAKERHEAALREASQQEAQPMYASTAFASSGVRDRGGPLLRLELGGKLQSGSSTSSSLQAASVSLSCPPKASGSSRRVQSTPTQPPPSSTPTFSTTNVSSSPSSTSSARPPPPSSTAAAALPQPATAKSTATTTSSAGGGDALDALLGGASTAQRETSSSSSVPPPKRNTLDELFL